MLVSSFTLEMVAAQTYCHGQRSGIKSSCAMLVFGLHPSPGCCFRIRTIPLRCVCPFITPEVAARYGDKINYGVGVIRGCGRNIASGTKCGKMVVAAETYCEAQQRITMNACRMLLSGESPTPECCLRIRTIPLRCVCPFITPEIVSGFNAEQISYGVGIVRNCGRNIAPGTKCGGLTVP
ncbi:unnamed protein product [Cochlearia groenlandica]